MVCLIHIYVFEVQIVVCLELLKCPYCRPYAGSMSGCSSGNFIPNTTGFIIKTGPCMSTFHKGHVWETGQISTLVRFEAKLEQRAMKTFLMSSKRTINAWAAHELHRPLYQPAYGIIQIHNPTFRLFLICSSVFIDLMDVSCNFWSDANPFFLRHISCLVSHGFLQSYEDDPTEQNIRKA